MNAANQAQRAVARRRRWWLAGGVGLVLGLFSFWAWLAWPRHSTYYSDAETIREPLQHAQPRDVLWKPPVPLSEVVNTFADDYEPRVGWDGLTLYFVRGKAGENADILVSIRTAGGWSPPESLESVNSAYEDLGPEPSADGQQLYFYSDRPGGSGGYDLWVSRRGENGWRPATNLGPQVNSPFNDYGPALSPDGRRLYFSSNRPQVRDQRQPNPNAWPATLREDLFHRTYDLYAADVTDAGLSTAAALQELNTSKNEGAPCVSPAGDFLYFSSDRPGGQGGFDLYRARRLAESFGAVSNLGPSLNTAANELDAGVTLGGFAIYFSSDRAAVPGPGTPPRYDLYYTVSREVFAQTERGPAPTIDWATLVPWGLLALLALLLALLAWALWGSLRDRRLSLLARCLLASLALHLLLMLMLGAWKVSTAVQQFLRHGPVQIALADTTPRAELAQQIRGALTDVPIPAAAVADAAPIEPELALLVEAPPEPQFADTPVLIAAAPLEAVRLEEVASRSPLLPPPTPRVLEPAPVEPRTPSEAQRIAQAEPQPERALSPERALAVRHAPSAWPTSQPLRADQPLEVPLDPSAAGQSRSLAQSPTVELRARPELPLPAPTAPPMGEAAAVPALAVNLPNESKRHADTTEARESPLVQPAANAVAAKAQLPSAPLPAPRESILEPSAVGEPRDPRSLAAPVVAANTMPAVHPANPLSAAPKVATIAPGVAPALPSETRRAPPENEQSTAPAPPAVVGAPRTERYAAPILGAAPAPVPARLEPAAPAAGEVRWQGVIKTPASSAAPRLPLAMVPVPDLSRPAVPPRAPADGLRLPSEVAPPADRLANRPAPQREEVLEQMGGSAETEKAVAAALDWLARHQSRDGRWSGGFDGRCGQCGGESEFEVETALTGLAILAFLGADHTHVKDGPYRQTVTRGLTWLLREQGDDGDLRGGETLYSHGIATIALAEAYAMSKDERLSGPVRRAVQFTAAARNRRQGGWRYEPGQAGDTSVLGWQVLALKSAESAGVEIPAELWEAAREWLERVSRTEQPGLYAYRPGRSFTPSMTAEGIFVQQLLGMARDDPRMTGAVALVMRHPPAWREANTYYWYYATLALFQQQGEAWPRWNERLKRELLANQRREAGVVGSWDPVGEWAPVGGRVYQTAICTLMLEVYYRYLPMYALPAAARAQAAPPVDSR